MPNLLDGTYLFVITARTGDPLRLCTSRWERYQIITGDTGSGGGGYLGRNNLVPEVSGVPAIVSARGHRLEPWSTSPESAGSVTTGREWLAARLGTKIDNPNLQPNEYFVHGKLLC